MNKEEINVILCAFLLANIPEIITQEEFDDVKSAIKELQKKVELGETYKKLYGEVKKQKDELETSYDILQKNNTTLAKQKEEAYKIADDYYKENQQLQKQKDDVIDYITSEESINTFATIESREQWLKINKNLLRMLGEIE